MKYNRIHQQKQEAPPLNVNLSPQCERETHATHLQHERPW